MWPHEYERIVYGSLEYSRKDPSVGCTSHPRVRYVSLIDLRFNLFYKKKNNIRQVFVLFSGFRKYDFIVLTKKYKFLVKVGQCDLAVLI